MEFVTSPTVLSSGLLLVSAIAYWEASLPPNPRADQKIQVNAGVGRLLPWDWAVASAKIYTPLVMIHFGLEIFSLWTLRGSSPAIANICPLADQVTMQDIYPAQKLSLSATLSVFLVLLSSLTRSACHRNLGKMFTWETSILQDHKLITSGPYRFVRHPSYTSLACINIGYIWFLSTPGTVGWECFIGSSLLSFSFNAKNAFGVLYRIGYIVLYGDTAVFLVRRSFTEDGMLKREFGKEWEEWAGRVRWNVIPYVL